jgi:hypothetical protein
MNQYEKWLTRVTGFAFVLGPLLFIVASVVWLLEIGVHEQGEESATEGIIMAYAIICFVPIFLALSNIVGPHAPRLAIFCAVGGTVSVMAGVTAGLARVFEGVILEQGGTLDEDIWAIVSGPELVWISILGLVFPLVVILLGIGLWRSGEVPKLSAGLFAAGGVLFFLAQAGEVAMEVTYPLMGICWLVALAPLGWQRMQLKLNSTTQRAQQPASLDAL